MEDQSQPASVDLKPYLRTWISSALAERPCDVPKDDYFAILQTRLGDALLARLALGLREGLIVEKGYRFQVRGGTTGPFLWFSRREWENYGLHPNWEAFVHLDYFVRLSHAIGPDSITLSFEDQNMDLAIRKGDQVWWCIEVKEKGSGPASAQSLARRLIRYGQDGVEASMPDRGNDPLRKAKYLLTHKPEFFSAVALNHQSHHKVTLRDATHFTLEETSPPLEF